jgi:hypothetical protein
MQGSRGAVLPPHTLTRVLRIVIQNRVVWNNKLIKQHLPIAVYQRGSREFKPCCRHAHLTIHRHHGMGRVAAARPSGDKAIRAYQLPGGVQSGKGVGVLFQLLQREHVR